MAVLAIQGTAPLAHAQDLSEKRELCQANPADTNRIESCVRDLRSAECDGIPAEQRRDCFSKDADANAPAQNSYPCVVGTVDGIVTTVQGAIEIAKSGYKAVTSNAEFKKDVKSKAAKTCEADKEVIASRSNYDQVVKNIGAESAAQNFLPKVNQIYSACLIREQKKGEALGLAIELPKTDDFKQFFSCMNRKAQTEMVCKVAGPMIAGGVAGAAIKMAVRSALRKMGLSAVGKVEKSFKQYIKSVEGKLTTKEIESLKHQKDLVDAMNNPEIAKRIEASGVDIDALTKGILDSDYGKLESGKKLLTEKSMDSDHLLDILRGKDQSRSGQAYRKHMTEIGRAGETDLNPALTNNDQRAVMSKFPILTGQLHELPGMSRAFKDFESGLITERQLIDRLNANRGHNHSGLEAGSKASKGISGNEITPFWQNLEGKFIPMSLKNDPAAFKFYENTVYDSGKRTAEGVVIPKYVNPNQQSVIIHSVFDRLSQGTGGGNIKIFYETAGAPLAENPKLPIGQIGDLSNFGKKNGLNNLANQLTGTIIKKDEKNFIESFSNSDMTNVQFRGLKEAVDRSSATATEKSALQEIVRAGRDRNLAYDEFAKNNISLTKDSHGNVTAMDFKDADGKYLGTIKLDTPTDEALKLVEKFNTAEQRVNGDPFKDIMKPRLLSPAEVVAYGVPASGAYFYCSSQKKNMSAPVEPGLLGTD